jgi:hypothetical protein
MKPWRWPVALLLLASSSCLRLQGPPDGQTCGSSDDCALDETCSAEGKCRPTNHCESSDDCAGQAACQDSACVPIECSAGDQSACLPYRCGGTRCLTHCLGWDDCVGGSKCVAGRCVEPQCLDDADCRGYLCQDGSCSTSCGLGYDCAADYVCLQGLCSVPPDKSNGASCMLDEECASHSCCFLPGLPTGHCVDDCHSRPDGVSCTLDESCISNHCTGGVCSTCGEVECGYVNGVLCGECPDGYLCNGTVCQEQTCDSNLPVFCKDNSFYDCDHGFAGGFRSSCGDTAYCEINSQMCVPYTCERNRGFCSSGTYRPCDETGHDAGGPARNCELLELDCSTLGCGNVHFDQVPSDTSNRSTLLSNTCGNLFEADKALTVLTVSQVVDSGGGEIRWFVYGSDALEGIYDSELPKAFVTSLLPYSPELHVTLVPGRYYFIGVQVVGANATYAFEPPLAAPPRLAFGRVIDSFCLLNGLNTTLSDRESHGVAVQQIESVELVP